MPNEWSLLALAHFLIMLMAFKIVVQVLKERLWEEKNNMQTHCLIAVFKHFVIVLLKQPSTSVFPQVINYKSYTVWMLDFGSDMLNYTKVYNRNTQN